MSLPGAPTITGITSGDGQVSVAFTGATGSPTNYQYSLDKGVTWTTRSPVSVANPLVITGLTNTTAYAIQLRAVNGVGTGPASNTSYPPAAPTITVVSSGDGQVSLAFTAGGVATGGSAIFNYSYSINNGGTWVARSPQSTASPLVITGLTNGTSYTIRLRALNGNAGLQSFAVSGTPQAVPVITSITPGNAQMTVDFTTGAGTVTNYEYSLNNGSTWTARSPASTTSPLTITGLTNTTAYQVRLRAVNGASIGGASTAVSPPNAPTISGVTATDGQLSMVCSGVSNSPTNFQYSLDNGTNWVTRSPVSTVSPLVISGLTNTSVYQVRVRAITATLTGFTSAAINPPSAPTITTITPGDGQLSLAFTASSVASGGASIFNYQYSLNNGSTWTTRSSGGATSPLLITGLTNGTAYDVRLRALNGTAGFASVGVSGTPLGLLSSATFLSKDYANDTFSLTYTLAASTALPTSSSAYTVNVSDGSAASFVFEAPDKIIVSGLQEYTDYVFTIAANNCSNTLTTATAKTLDITAPGVVTSTSCDVSSSQLTLNWSDVAVLGGSPITYYVFSSGSETVVGNALYSIASNGSGPYSYPVTGLTNRTAYSYYVRAIDADGNVGTAVTISGTPLGPALSAPASVSVSASANSATLTNYAVANADSYRAKLYSDSGLSVQVGSDVVVADASGIVFTGLTSATTYYATVTAERVGDVAYENSAASAAVSVVTAALTSHVASLLTNVTDASAFKASLASTVASLPASTNVAASAVNISSLVTQTLAGFTLPTTANMTMFLVKAGDTYTLPAGLNTSGYSYFSSAPNTSYTVAFTGGSLTFAFDASENVTIGGVAKSLGDTFVMNGQTYRYVAKGSVVVVNVPAAPTVPALTDPAVVPCFFGNARVLTPSGYRRMDSLKVGDSVVTPQGSEVSIERVKVTQCAAGPTTNPYVIPAGTFGASHRILISPDHKVCLSDGRRVEAKRLGLEQEDREGSLTYYNLELAGQADMVVGGVAVESLAPVRRVVMSMATFEAAVKSRYGSLSASVLANIKRTCRLVGRDAVEVPVMRR